MRTVLTFVFSLIVFSLSGQNACSEYFPFVEGATLKYSYYNRKDKLEATSSQIIQDVEEKNGVVTAEVTTKLTDAKGKETINGNFSVECKDGTFYMDMSEMMPAESLAALGSEDAEMEMSGDGFVLPSGMEVGQTLPDSENTIQFKAGIMNMSMTMDFKNRKVEARETITTPAGTFECLRFSYDVHTKMTMMKNESRTVNWYAEGVGTVKSETYNRKGKLESKMVLTEFKK